MASEEDIAVTIFIFWKSNFLCGKPVAYASAEYSALV
jgi:hypothetical protein